MIDALLFAVRDNVRGAGYGWDERTCDIMNPPGKPPPGCGDWWLSIYQGGSKSTMDNALDEYLGFSCTLTRRVSTPLDRIGTKVLTSSEIRRLAKDTGFNARADQLRAFLHMAWGIIQDANDFLVNKETDATQVYGFCEPARYRGMDTVSEVGPDWFSANPDELVVGIKAELRFDGARRLQAIATFV